VVVLFIALFVYAVPVGVGSVGFCLLNPRSQMRGLNAMMLSISLSVRSSVACFILMQLGVHFFLISVGE